MKMSRRKHYNAQRVFRSCLALTDGGSVTGPNWYWRKKCYMSLRQQYKRMGLLAATQPQGKEEPK